MDYVWLYSITFALNVPFGYARSFFPEKNVRNFTIKMFLIHAPIPVVIILRKFLGIDWHVWVVVTGVMVCILGQLFGGRVLATWLRRPEASQCQPKRGL